MFNHPVYAEPFETDFSGSCPNGIWISPRREIHKCSGKYQCSVTSTVKRVSWCSEGTSHILICACCLWSCHWTPLNKRPFLCSLYTFPSGTYIYWRDHPKPPLSQAEQSQLFSLSSQERCSITLITLVAPHRTLSSMFMSLISDSPELDTVFQAWPYQRLRIPS